jgi:tetratricopeptide (TPR) repeat protein
LLGILVLVVQEAADISALPWRPLGSFVLVAVIALSLSIASCATAGNGGMGLVEDSAAYLNCGIAYYNKGDYDRAIANFTQAITLNPNDAEAYNSRGTAHGAKGDHDKAIADYETALRIDPNYIQAKINFTAARQARGY